jgi:fumarate hydratase subunit alpha
MRLSGYGVRKRWLAAQAALDDIIANYELAESKEVTICQDGGIASVFVAIGQDVHVEGNLKDAINEGVRRRYTNGFLRGSMVRDPFLERVNTGDNTPALIQYEIVPGDKLEITIAPKGAGSENMSRTAMRIPTGGGGRPAAVRAGNHGTCGTRALPACDRRCWLRRRL